MSRIEQAQGYRRSAGSDHAVGRRDALELQALGVDDIAVLVELKLSVAAVHRAARAVVHLEEAAAIDGGIQRIVGGGDVALAELLQDGRDLGTDTHRRRTRAAQGGREHVGKLCRAALETYRTRVGNIVADGVERLGRGVKTT